MKSKTKSNQEETLEKTQNFLNRRKISEQTNTNHIEAMNNRVSDSIERGFQPSWVLETTAKHLALNALENEDEKWVEMINYLTTQGGPEGGTLDLRELGANTYGRTIKGRTIILDTMKKLRAKQAQGDKNAIALWNHRQKEIKLEFTSKAARLMLRKPAVGTPEYKTWSQQYAAIAVEAADKGLTTVLKGEIENANNIKKDFGTIDDNEMREMLKGMMMAEKGADVFESNYHQKFMDAGFALSDKQEGDITTTLASIRNYDKIKEVESAVGDGNALVDEMITGLKERFPGVTFGTDAGLNQLVREQKRAIRDSIKDIYVDHLSRQTRITPYEEWDKEGQDKFKEAINIRMKSVIPTKSKLGFSGEIYELLLNGFKNHEPPVTLHDKSVRVKTLVADRGSIEYRIKMGQAYEGDEELLETINEELAIIDLDGENKRKEAEEKAKILSERTLLTLTSGEKRDIKLNKQVAATLIAGAKQSKEFTEDAINNLKDEAQVRFGTAAEAKVQRWLKAIVAPQDTHATKRISKYYNNLVRSIFPGFLEGFLDSALRFDVERKLEKVPEKATRLIDKSTENARLIIENMMGKEIDIIQKPYKLWTNEQRNAFTKNVKTALTKPNKEQIKIYKELEINEVAFGNKHLSRLRALMPRDEVSMSAKNLYLDLKNKDLKRFPEGKPLDKLSKDEAEIMYDLYIKDGTITGSGLVSHKARIKALGIKLKTYNP